jgi:hypothetical protein
MNKKSGVHPGLTDRRLGVAFHGRVVGVGPVLAGQSRLATPSTRATTARLHACRSRAPTEDGCVLIMADATKPNEQRRFASQTPGAVVAENVDMRDLVDFAETLDLDDDDVLGTVVNFARAS